MPPPPPVGVVGVGWDVLLVTPTCGSCLPPLWGWLGLCGFTWDVVCFLLAPFPIWITDFLGLVLRTLHLGQLIAELT